MNTLFYNYGQIIAWWREDHWCFFASNKLLVTKVGDEYTATIHLDNVANKVNLEMMDLPNGGGIWRVKEKVNIGTVPSNEYSYMFYVSKKLEDLEGFLSN